MNELDARTGHRQAQKLIGHREYSISSITAALSLCQPRGPRYRSTEARGELYQALFFSLSVLQGLKDGYKFLYLIGKQRECGTELYQPLLNPPEDPLSSSFASSCLQLQSVSPISRLLPECLQ